MKWLLRILTNAADSNEVHEDIIKAEKRRLRTDQGPRAYRFHAGCNGCMSVNFFDINICRRCGYYPKNDYNKYPDLSSSTENIEEILMSIESGNTHNYWPDWSEEELFDMIQEVLQMIAEWHQFSAKTNFNIWAIMNSHVFINKRAEVSVLPIPRMYMFKRVDKVLKAALMDRLVANET